MPTAGGTAASILADIIDCSAPDSSTESDGRNLRIAGLFAILATSAVGVSLPLLSRGRFPKLLFLARAFGAGVVIATGFVHVMVDSFNALTNPCLGLSTTYPWSMVFAAFAALATFAIELGMTAVFRARLGVSARDTCPTPMQMGQLQDLEVTQAAVDEKRAQLQLLDDTVVSYVLEAGMIVHSLTIGIAFGSNTDAGTIVALIIALCFHQSLDGIALGTTFTKAQYSFVKYFWFAMAFVLVTPIGVAIGLLVGTHYHSNSPTVLGVEGVLNAISAGILIYNGLVDLLIPTFHEHPGNKPRRLSLTLSGFASLFIGCGAMCGVAKWA